MSLTLLLCMFAFSFWIHWVGNAPKLTDDEIIALVRKHATPSPRNERERRALLYLDGKL